MHIRERGRQGGMHADSCHAAFMEGRCYEQCCHFRRARRRAHSIKARAFAAATKEGTGSFPERYRFQQRRASGAQRAVLPTSATVAACLHADISSKFASASNRPTNAVTLFVGMSKFDSVATMPRRLSAASTRTISGAEARAATRHSQGYSASSCACPTSRHRQPRPPRTHRPRFPRANFPPHRKWPRRARSLCAFRRAMAASFATPSVQARTAHSAAPSNGARYRRPQAQASCPQAARLARTPQWETSETQTQSSLAFARRDIFRRCALPSRHRVPALHSPNIAAPLPY